MSPTFLFISIICFYGLIDNICETNNILPNHVIQARGLPIQGVTGTAEQKHSANQVTHKELDPVNLKVIPKAELTQHEGHNNLSSVNLNVISKAELSQHQGHETSKAINSSPRNTSAVNSSSTKTYPKPDGRRVNSTEVESGALMRGLLVFVALSVLFMIYLAFGNYCSKKSKTIVRKYGIRARRTDVEMTPLPLSEDEEDESTVFDVARVSR